MLEREKPFVMSVPAQLVWEESKPEEEVLVQGIIDVFWEEEDGIVLLDYKTDRVDNAEELIRRYKKQLELYGWKNRKRNIDLFLCTGRRNCNTVNGQI